MLFRLLLILTTILLYMPGASAQVSTGESDSPVISFYPYAKFERTDSGIIVIQQFSSICRLRFEKQFFMPYPPVALVPARIINAIPKLKEKLLTVHGNVSYDYFYRSKIDTPFSQQNLQQHTERVWLDVLVKEKYPFKAGFTARQSNSPFFRDLYNLNIQFDRYKYNNELKQNLTERLTKYKWDNPDLKLIDSALQFQLRKLQALQSVANSPDILQKLIEQKEAIYFRKKREQADPSLLSDSLSVPDFTEKSLGKFGTFLSKKDSLAQLQKEGAPGFNKEDLTVSNSLIDQKTVSNAAKLDSLQKLINTLKHRSDSIRNSIAQGIAKAKKLIYSAKTPGELEKIAFENGLNKPPKEKIQNFLADVKVLGIGRSMVDYTELTAQNVMLTGINVVYNPSYYAAFAAGKIDFGFRDFLGRENKQKNQYLTLGRFGWGNIDKRAVILTVFNGRKADYAGVLTAGNRNSNSKLFGYSVEAVFRKNENTLFSIEVAKSTKYNSSSVAADSVKSDNLFKYSDQSNMGFNIKAQTIIPQTNTLLSGFYRKTGTLFQSFSLFTYNTNQQAWQVRADQSFLNRKINITAMLRQNDFTNPLAVNTFKTTAVFKTFHLNVKLPHWPVLNAGYYPGSQFYIIDNNTIRENVYYILNGSLLYPYTCKDISMSSSVMYNRFFNQSTDTGFIFYKGINYTIHQSVLLKRLQVQGSYAYNQQAEIVYYTLDANGDYAFKKVLKIGGGIKYNHVQAGANYWGESVRLAADLKKLGGLQISYEKSYLPTVQQTLYPVEIGRVSWYKSF